MKLVILSYNHPQITERCVRTSRDFFSDKDIVLVHNGSEEKWVAGLKQQFPDIEHLVLAKNKGFSGGANAGLIHGFKDSDWIFFLTNDCQIKKVPSTPPDSPAFVAPLIYLRKESLIDSCGGALDLRTGRLRHLKSPHDRLKPHEHFYVPGSAFLLHKDVFSAAGPFMEKLETFWEDVEFSLRCQRKSLLVNTTTDWQVLHAGGKTCHKDARYTTYLFQRNRSYVTQLAQEYFEKKNLRSSFYFYLYKDWLKHSAKALGQRRFSSLKNLWLAHRDVSPLKKTTQRDALF